MSIVNSAAARWTAVAAWSGLIFWFSSQTSVPLPSFAYADKYAHATEYGIYGLLVARALFPLMGRHPRATRWAAVLIWCLLYAISDEIHQSFVPGRSCDSADALADTLGATVTAGGVELIRLATNLNLVAVRPRGRRKART